jgi:hypothetical protein
MADTWTDTGLIKLFATANIDTTTARLHLYQNNLAIAFGTLIGALTEATFTGYASIANMWSGAGAPAATAPGAIQTTNPQTFTAGAIGVSNNIYGWYVTEAGSTALAAGGLFVGGPFAINTAGQTITVTVQVTLLEV